MSRQNFTYALAWNDMDCDSLWFYWQRWDWLRLAGCEGTFTFSKPPQSIAKRHEFWGYVELEWWSHWGIFWIFSAAVGPVQLVFLLEAQACSSRNLITCCSSAEFGSNMFLDNVWQAQASFLQTTCRIQMRKTMRRASWAFLCLFEAPFLQIHIDSLILIPMLRVLGFFLVDLHVMHLQAQRATSSRHVGFDKET